jgi:hypothetical protein
MVRKEDLVVQEMDGEILIYDLRENKAFCLNEAAAQVWLACDGNKTIAEIAKQVGNEDAMWLALTDLKKQKLIDLNTSSPSRIEGMSRRQVIGRIGVGSMLAIPVIASLVAPVSAQAVSNCGMACAQNSECNVPNATCTMCSGNPATPGVCVA